MIASQAQILDRYCKGKPLLYASLLLLLLLLTTDQVQAQSCTPYPSPQTRFGFNVARDDGRHIEQYNVTPLKAHWYLDYFTQVTPATPANMVYAQMIRPPFWKKNTFTATVESTLQNNPGTLWIVGNEPDRYGQDGLTPAQYAIFYHDVYTFLKRRDPSARVAIAGVVQSTPLRRRYLDMVLTEYQTRYAQAMPVDIWTMHAFILPENCGWGADIPPGLEAYRNEGITCPILHDYSMHDDIEIFKTNLIAFRQWMADRGYRDKPLLVTEYGILLSPLHGFSYEIVRDFMLASFDFFLTATDAATGYSADENRLVQAWSWFSLNYPPYDLETEKGHNGNLVEPDAGTLLPLGQDYGDYIAALAQPPGVSLGFSALHLTPPTVIITPTALITTAADATPALGVSQGVTTTFTLTATLANEGTVAACNLTLYLYHQDPQGRQTRLATQTVARLTPTAAGSSQTLSFTWTSTNLTAGLHKVILTAAADNSATGLPIAQVRRESAFHVLTEPFSVFIYLPVTRR